MSVCVDEGACTKAELACVSEYVQSAYSHFYLSPHSNPHPQSHPHLKNYHLKNHPIITLTVMFTFRPQFHPHLSPPLSSSLLLSPPLSSLLISLTFHSASILICHPYTTPTLTPNFTPNFTSILAIHSVEWISAFDPLGSRMLLWHPVSKTALPKIFAEVCERERLNPLLVTVGVWMIWH